MINRRGLITGLISLAAAPAIVRASSLMPVKVIDEPQFVRIFEVWDNKTYQLDIMYGQINLYGMSMMEIANANNSDGIVFTPIHDYLKLD
jgi:hypothetical protein